MAPVRASGDERRTARPPARCAHATATARASAASRERRAPPPSACGAPSRRARLPPAGTRRPCSRTRGPWETTTVSLPQMQRAHDLGDALSLRSTLAPGAPGSKTACRCRPDRSRQPIVTFRAIAGRAAAGLWRARSVGLEQRRGGAAEDRQPARLADVAGADGRFDRAPSRRSPMRVRRDRLHATSSCSAWAARASRPRCCAPCSASRPAGRASTCSIRPIRRPFAPWPRRPRGRCTSSRASPARPSSRIRSPRTSAISSSVRASAAGRSTSSRSPTKAPSWRRARGPSDSAMSSSIRPTSAAATRRSRSSASCPRRSWARTWRRSSAGRWRCSPRPQPADDAASQSGGRARPGDGRRGASRPRQARRCVLPPALEPFGLWVEQLVAESTGKQGVGVVPIAGERIGADQTMYRNDRLLRARPERERCDDDSTPRRSAGSGAGAPIVTIDVPEPRRSAPNSCAGRSRRPSRRDPRHQSLRRAERPAGEGRDAGRCSTGYKAAGRLPAVPADATSDRRAGDAHADAARAEDRRSCGRPAFSRSSGAGDYVALLAYVGPDAGRRRSGCRAFRIAVRERTGAATMFGYGPRYLHSTGQLHKGGPNNGRVRAWLPRRPREDLPIPGESFSFGTLELAQALGDFAVARRDGPARAARAPAGARRRRVEGRARRPAGGDSHALPRHRAAETGSGIAAAPRRWPTARSAAARSPATSTSGTWAPRGGSTTAACSGSRSASVRRPLAGGARVLGGVLRARESAGRARAQPVPRPERRRAVGVLRLRLLEQLEPRLAAKGRAFLREYAVGRHRSRSAPSKSELRPTALKGRSYDRFSIYSPRALLLPAGAPGASCRRARARPRPRSRAAARARAAVGQPAARRRARRARGARRGVAAAGRSRPGGDRARPAAGHVSRHDLAEPAVHALAAARPAGLGARRSVARHRAARPRAEAGRSRARLARHRPRALRARPVLPPGRRHRHRPRAHHQGRVGAARGRRPASPRARPLAVEHLARAARPLRRGDDGAAAGRAARLARAGRRRAGDRLRQPGERDDARAPLRAGAGAGRAQRLAPRGARLGPRPGGRAGHARTDLRAARRPGPRRRGAAPRARRAQPDSVSRDDRRRVRHARADSPDARPLRRRQRVPRRAPATRTAPTAARRATGTSGRCACSARGSRCGAARSTKRSRGPTRSSRPARRRSTRCRRR